MAESCEFAALQTLSSKRVHNQIPSLLFSSRVFTVHVS